EHLTHPSEQPTVIMFNWRMFYALSRVLDQRITRANGTFF
ncbi:MAG: hypothetical protein ACI8T1_003370, partial [Verrucomicrobiales bacterium]